MNSIDESTNDDRLVWLVAVRTESSGRDVRKMRLMLLLLV